MKNGHVFEIANKSLQTVKFFHESKEKLTVVLDIPNVHLFKYVGDEVMDGNYVVKNFSRLDKAYIMFNAKCNEGYSSLLKLAHAVSHVRRVKLSILSFPVCF